MVLKSKKKYVQIERYFYGSLNLFRQQVWGLGIFPCHYIADLKISRKSGADSCGTLTLSVDPSQKLDAPYFGNLLRILSGIGLGDRCVRSEV